MSSIVDAAIPESDLPETVRDLVSLIGMQSTLRLVDSFGGLTILVPKGDERRGIIGRESLIEVVGRRCADRLIERYGGTRLYVASCRRAILALRDRSICSSYPVRSVKELAIEHGLSDRQVWAILKKTDMSQAPQGSLF